MQNAEMALTLKHVRRMDSDGIVERSPVPKRTTHVTESCDGHIGLSCGEVTIRVYEDRRFERIIYLSVLYTFVSYSQIPREGTHIHVCRFFPCKD